jgi:hypothetical protein
MEPLDLLNDFTWENYKQISSQLLQVNEKEVETELRLQASRYSMYHGLMCRCKAELSEREREAEFISASIREEVRNSSTSKAPAHALESIVNSNQEYNDKIKEVNEAAFRYEMLKGLTKALEQKKDMLVQISSNNRAEVKLYN